MPVGRIEKSEVLNLTPPAARVGGDNDVVEQPELEVVFNFPLINEQNIKTAVIIPDGGTVILGGLADLSRSLGKATTPLLGDIPILKIFFSTKGSRVLRDSLVVLLKADITVVPSREKRFLEEG